MAIVKRLVKGSALTHAELDGNFDQLVADIGGVLPSQTGNNGKVLSTNGTAASWINPPESLPSQTGNSGKYLTTNGTVASWADVVGGAASFALGGNLTLDNTYAGALIYNTSSSNYTISIPAGLNNYFTFYVQQNGTGTITIQEVAASGVVIDGAPLVTAGAGDSIQVLWLGTDHYAVSMAELPDYSALDENKVLTVDASGDLVWTQLNPTYTLSGNLTAATIHNNSVVYNTTSSDYTITVPSGLPDYFSFATQQNGTGSITLAAGAGVTIDGLPAVTVGIGDVITLNWIATDHYSVQVSQIPEYTSSDAGKVLTVGAGGETIEWAPTATSSGMRTVTASESAVINDDGATILCNSSSGISITIPPDYTLITGTGSITSATNSTAVTGSGTAFNTELAVGDKLYTNAGLLIGTIFSITDATNLVLTSNAQQATSVAAFKHLSTTAVNWQLGATISLVRYGTGSVSFAGGKSYVTIRDSGIVAPNQYGTLGIMKVLPNEWILL